MFGGVHRTVYLQPGQVTAVEGEDFKVVERRTVSPGVRGQTNSVSTNRIRSTNIIG